MKSSNDLSFKSSPKQNRAKHNLKNFLKKIPPEVLDEMPEIKDAFDPGQKPDISIIKKGEKPEYIRLNKQMNFSDIKLFTKINEMKDLVYEINNEDYKEDLNNISKENELFEKNYKKIKKEKNKFHRGTYLDFEPFLYISSRYVANKMKVPNLSDDHNLFSGNPLILQGSELNDFIIYNFGERNKGIKFLKKMNKFVKNKINEDGELSVNETERLEKLKKEEKPKGYIPPEKEIPILKNDISNSEQTLKNLIEFEDFFKPKKKKFKLFRNRSFNDSIEQSPFNNYMRKITSNFKYENINQNNSLVTSTTSIGITRKSSPKNSNKINILKLNNFGFNYPKDFKLKLPKLETPGNPSNIFDIKNSYKNNKNLRIKKISFNNSLKLDSNSISRNKETFHIFNNRLYNIEHNKKIYKLLKSSGVHSNNDDKKNNYYSSLESDASEIFELNKEIEKNKKTKFNLDNSFLQNKNTNTNNIIIPKLNLNNNKTNENKSFDSIKIDPDINSYNKAENLFNLVKNKSNNSLKKETKKDIESYISSKGKSVENILTNKSSYYRLHSILIKPKNKSLIPENYAMRRNKLNAKALSKKQKFILDKNSGFMKEMIKEKEKFNQLLFRDKSI